MIRLGPVQPVTITDTHIAKAIANRDPAAISVRLFMARPSPV
jgi:hypothetical protein